MNEIVDRLSRDQPHVSKHLRVLSDSGLVIVERSGRQRIYRLDAEPFAEMQEWIDSFGRTWGERLDRLGTFLHNDDQKDE